MPALRGQGRRGPWCQEQRAVLAGGTLPVLGWQAQAGKDLGVYFTHDG